MNESVDKRQKDIDVNLAPILIALLKKAWLIILAAVIVGAGSYTVSKILIDPTYRSGFTAYVNNQTQTGRDSLTSSDILASQNLVMTYSKVIVSDTVLMPAAKAINLDYSYEKLSGMVSTVVEDETEIINVYVVARTPQLAYELAQSIAKVSPAHMADIIEGSSMKIIDNPRLQEEKFAPSYFRMGLIGALIGAALAIAVIIILFLRDDTIKQESDLEDKFGLPVVGIIPDMLEVSSEGDSYSYKQSSHQYNGSR